MCFINKVWCDMTLWRVTSLMWDVLAFLWADCPDYFPRGLKECHYLALKWKHLLRSVIVFAREQLSVDVLWTPFESFVQCVKVWLDLTSPQADWGLEAWLLWAMMYLWVSVCVWTCFTTLWGPTNVGTWLPYGKKWELIQHKSFILGWGLV